MTWKLTWGDHVFTEADLTVADVAAAQVLTGDGWRSADPLQGPNHAANLLAVLVGRAEGRSALAVVEELAVLPAAEIVKALGPSDPPS